MGNSAVLLPSAVGRQTFLLRKGDGLHCLGAVKGTGKRELNIKNTRRCERMLSQTVCSSTTHVCTYCYTSLANFSQFLEWLCAPRVGEQHVLCAERIFFAEEASRHFPSKAQRNTALHVRHISTGRCTFFSLGAGGTIAARVSSILSSLKGETKIETRVEPHCLIRSLDACSEVEHADEIHHPGVCATHRIQRRQSTAGNYLLSLFIVRARCAFVSFPRRIRLLGVSTRNHHLPHTSVSWSCKKVLKPDDEKKSGKRAR